MNAFTLENCSSLMNAVNNSMNTPNNSSMSPSLGGNFIFMPDSIVNNPLYDPFGPCWGNEW